MAGVIKILIVEDEKPIRDLIALNLTEAGYKCETAADGAQASAQVYINGNPQYFTDTGRLLSVTALKPGDICDIYVDHDPVGDETVNLRLLIVKTPPQQLPVE